MKKITLIIGGIRSGKSYFAEKKALYYSEKPVYIATAISFDKDMEARIALHRERRGDRFRLIEEPHDITIPLSGLTDCTVLVDCLTINLSNRLLEKEDDLNLGELMADGEEYLHRVHEIIIKNRLNVIFVSNEVGLAPVEANRLGRYFQDLQGRWNRLVAEFADEVYLLQAGIPSQIKKVPVHPFKISAPSYLLPTGYIENVTYLMDKVDDIQLLLFDTVMDDPLLKNDTISTLAYLSADAGITFSVHMPTSPLLFDDFDKRLDTACFIIEKLELLPVSYYTFHYDLPNRGKWHEVEAGDKQRIDDVYMKFINSIKSRFPNIGITLENTATPLSALDRVVNTCEVSYCIDIGHLLQQDWDLSELDERIARSPVIHLHGLEDIKGKCQDHRPIGFDRNLFKKLESFEGILTIENYHKLLFNKSIEVLKTYF